MRIFLAILLLAAVAQPAHAAEPSPPPTWPLWDGAESVEQYAKRTNLEPTRTLDLGNGVKLEMVLIPAGKFVMGTEEPESVEIGEAILLVAGSAALILITVPLVRAIRQRRRFQFSLRWLILLVAVLGVAQYGGFRWWRAAEAWNDYDGDERPAHKVTISKAYFLGRFEVTQEQYQQVMGTNPSAFKGRDLPVERISWNDAQEFCKKASEVARSCGSRGDPAGRPTVIRLPTEGEWEHACRAGTKTTYYTGDEEADLDRAAWYYMNSDGTAHSAGQKVPNAWGLCDMHGNVWEWVQDVDGPYKGAAEVDPQGPEQGQSRVYRGGSWGIFPGGCPSAHRNGGTPDAQDDDIGFRVAASVPPKAP